MNYKEIDKLIKKYLLLLMVFGFILFNTSTVFLLLNKIFQATYLILLSFLVAFVLNLVMVRFQKLLDQINSKLIKKHKIVISLLLAITTIILIIYSLCMLVIPELVNSITLLLELVPNHGQTIFDKLVSLFQDAPNIATALESIEVDWKTLLDNMMNFMSSGFTDLLDTTISITISLVGTIFNSILVAVFSIYLVLEKKRLLNTIKRILKLYVSARNYHRIRMIYTITNDTFGSFISGQCIEAVILGSLCALGMTILRMPYAIMIGTLVGTINIIPIIGAYIGGTIGAFMVFTVSPTTAILFVFYLIVLQQFESNVIYPRVVGNSVGLPGIYVLATVMIFGSLAGIPGMFFGIPTVASVYKLSKIYIRNKEKMV
ncbi:AI-2E family transporter [Tannockella kyphosi]|uniref:AI-2E family transporter n=1 Tax=Tannockella kyphosi TaxID=2899121 RepID=UPI002011184A|nr:AI-2E family transporter [Tannockella kyphosi]